MDFLTVALRLVLKAVVVFLICLIIVSHFLGMLQDSSAEPEYVAIIGERFRVKDDLWAVGITADRNYKKQIDYVALKSVGLSGPEVVSKDRISKNAIIKINRVLVAKFLFFSREIYIVEIEGSSKFKGTEVRVRLIGSSADSNLGLDRSVYERIK